MDANEKMTASPCKRLRELPPVFADWQQKAWWPDCDHYSDGQCSNPTRRGGSPACPFDGEVLPLREVTVETPDNQPRSPLDVGPREAQEIQPRFKALEQAIKLRIVDRTGGRIRALAIELTDRGLVVRGNAPCYYVKQLALQGVLDVLNSDNQIKIECNIQIVVGPPGPTED
jgi:hypothetical protein